MSTRPKKDGHEYILAYRNTTPNRVKPKKAQSESQKKPKTETPAFVMEHDPMYDMDDDTE